MRAYKDKQYIVFEREDGKVCKYNLQTHESIGFSGRVVKDIRSQLKGIDFYQMLDCFEDRKYADFIRFVFRELNPGRYTYVTNIGSVLSHVREYSRYEQYFAAGIKIEKNYYSWYPKYELKDIPKAMLKVVRKYDISVTNDLVESWMEEPDAYNLMFKLDYISLNKIDLLDIWQAGRDSRKSQCYFNRLIRDYGYNAKSLLLYLDHVKTFEAIEGMSYLLRELVDYASMMSVISPKYDKYPSNFLTTHQIAIRNYNRLKKEFSEDVFKSRYKERYNCQFGDYVFIYPKTTQDIKDEAAQQSNCVASYIDNVIDGKCDILFLRKANEPDKSLVTIEVINNRIVQARQRFNNPVTEEQQEAINQFNKKFAKHMEVAA